MNTTLSRLSKYCHVAERSHRWTNGARVAPPLCALDSVDPSLAHTVSSQCYPLSRTMNFSPVIWYPRSKLERPVTEFVAPLRWFVSNINPFFGTKDERATFEKLSSSCLVEKVVSFSFRRKRIKFTLSRHPDVILITIFLSLSNSNFSLLGSTLPHQHWSYRTDILTHAHMTKKKFSTNKL